MQFALDSHLGAPGDLAVLACGWQYRKQDTDELLLQQRAAPVRQQFVAAVVAERAQAAHPLGVPASKYRAVASLQ
jgi:hypothetical protein